LDVVAEDREGVFSGASARRLGPVFEACLGEERRGDMCCVGEEEVEGGVLGCGGLVEVAEADLDA